MQKVDLRNFDYKEVAQLDSVMWRAYYNHEFLKLFFYLIQLTKTQLRLGWPTTLHISMQAAWAAAYYRLHKHRGVDNAQVLKPLSKFFKSISEHSTQSFDYKKAAELELEWWDIHRRSTKNNKKLEYSLAAAAATIHNVEPKQLAEYAHYRAEAMILPRHEGDAQPEATDWSTVTRLLERSWHALYTKLN